MDFELHLNSSKKNDIINYMNSFNFELVDVSTQTYNQKENLNI
jgi:acetolactate synthase small subunit